MAEAPVEPDAAEQPDTAQALAAGYLAARTGKELTDNPYTAEQAAARYAWTRGWGSGARARQ